MSLLKHRFDIERRRPSKRPSSFPVRQKKWRARSFSFWLPWHKRLVVTIRRFRTNPNRDSKSYKQFIFETYRAPIKEVAFAIRKRPRNRKKQQAFLPFIMPARAVISTLLIVGGLSLTFYFATHLHKQVSFNLKPSQKVQAISNNLPAKTLPAAIPVRLQIPKIGVDTNLQQVGLQANGQMETPWDITVAAWYKYSPTPGQLGPSVIVGHLDGANYANMAGVFYRLNELAPDDEFSVTRADGSIAKFKVNYLEQVPQNNFPTQEIYGNLQYAGIRLITCGGTFDTETNHYSDNTVVFASLE